MTCKTSMDNSEKMLIDRIPISKQMDSKVGKLEINPGIILTTSGEIHTLTTTEEENITKDLELFSSLLLYFSLSLAFVSESAFEDARRIGRNASETSSLGL